MKSTCSECGARLEPGASECSLCGTPVAGAEAVQSAPRTEDDTNRDVEFPSEKEPIADEKAMPEPADAAAGVFCNQCGWENPLGARFCSRCGSRLQDVAEQKSDPDQTAAGQAGPSSSSKSAGAPPPSHRKPPGSRARFGIPGSVQSKQSKKGAKKTGADTGKNEEGVGRQMMIIIGAGVLVVVALYMISVMRTDNSPPPSSGGLVSAVPSGPLAAQFVDEEQSLKNELAALDGNDKITKQQQLIALYIRAARLDLAGDVAQQIAEATNSERAWIDAGNMYFDRMDSQQGAEKQDFAKKAVAAYQKALKINPDNLDVRTDMAIAYMYDPENARKAIEETAAVLAVDSLHVQANFNRGIMLMQINRLDQARAQFEKVQRIVGDPEDPVYQRAGRALASIQ